ncbi:MAG: LytTR family DNA-binding domain-containing protein [Bacteroidota bacterium]
MNVLIVEDESHTASLLQEVIEQDEDFMVVEKLESVVETVHYLNKYQKNLDILFFDIQLADGKSFEIFKHIDVLVPVVFCTAYDDYTLEAIKNNGIDYVLKPFKEVEIHQALKKYKRLISNIQSKNTSPIHFQGSGTKQYQQSFLTPYREKSLIIRAEEVALFAVEHESVYVYTLAGEKYPILKKLEYLESVCDPSQFFRINRQMLVNRNAILSFEPYFNRKIILQLKVKVEEKAIVSRLKVSACKDWLES